MSATTTDETAADDWSDPSSFEQPDLSGDAPVVGHLSASDNTDPPDIARVAHDIADPIADQIVEALRRQGITDVQTAQMCRVICYGEALRFVLERVGIPTTVTYPKGW